MTKYHTLPANATILEVGCGEGGVLRAFCEAGYVCHGIDLSETRVAHARNFFAAEIERGRVTFYACDIRDSEKVHHLHGKIDLLILKDAIEHIPDQEKILADLRNFVKKDGRMFIAFPPWHSPFGGHQQLAGSYLRFVPWVHILPESVYLRILRMCGETQTKIEGLSEIYRTRLSMSRFERFLAATKWQVVKRQLFLFNPIYEYKFNIKGRKQFALVNRIPRLRDFFSTGVYYLLQL